MTVCDTLECGHIESVQSSTVFDDRGISYLFGLLENM